MISESQKDPLRPYVNRNLEKRYEWIRKLLQKMLLIQNEINKTPL